MRLLNATTLLIETVLPGKEPPYAILSHRWTDDEVLLNDIQNRTARHKASFAKLKGCCKVALGQGLSHVWIDTCCIDQNSSAELSEAINSMFRWYRGAQVCYAYLSDADGPHDYLASQWFDRGWTLQELIAPREVQFYAKSWTQFGDRARLSPPLSARTGIAEEYLQGSNIWNAPIAERMSWAARRETTKPEDIAYCLLGIFNIHMPLIYGEGAEKAFIRLQREVIGSLNSTDDSWMAWDVPPGRSAALPGRDSTQSQLDGMLARSPLFFQNCRHVVLVQRTATAQVSMTSAGIHVRVPIATMHRREYLLLGCHPRSDYWNVIAVPVAKHFGRYYRTRLQTTRVEEVEWSKAHFSREQRSWIPDEAPQVEEVILAPDPYTVVRATGEDLFYAIKPLPAGFRVVEVFPPDAWEPHRYIHISLGTNDNPKLAPRRLVRLERFGSDPNHYILELSLRSLRRSNFHWAYKPYCRVGCVPRDSPTLRADLTDIQLGKFVRIQGAPTVLTAEVTQRTFQGREAYVVRVFRDEEQRIRRSFRGVEDEPEWNEATTRRREREMSKDEGTNLAWLGVCIYLLFLFIFLILYWCLAPPAGSADGGNHVRNRVILILGPLLLALVFLSLVTMCSVHLIRRRSGWSIPGYGTF